MATHYLSLVSLVAPSSSAPRYVTIQSGFRPWWLGTQISYDVLGKSGAGLGLRVLAGESHRISYPPQIVPSAAMFDCRELQRWISMKRNTIRQHRKIQGAAFWDNTMARCRSNFTSCPGGAAHCRLLYQSKPRRQAEKDNERLARLAEAEQNRLDEVISNVPGIVWEARTAPGTNGQLVSFVSEHVEKMLGYRVEEWLSTPGFAMTIVAEEDRERAKRETQAILESGKDGVLQFRWVTKDGRIYG